MHETLTRTPPQHAPLPLKVLAISAHPDDLELACGATLSKLVHSGHTVAGMVMSAGQIGGDPSQRAGEVLAGARIMGLADIQAVGLPDTELAEHGREMIRAIEAKLLEFAPDVILTHSQHDAHQDHEAVHRAVKRAARQHHTIMCFESPSTTQEFSPRLFVDVTGFVETKIRAIASHTTQTAKPYMDGDMVTSIARVRGAQSKHPMAEGFELVRASSQALWGF